MIYSYDGSLYELMMLRYFLYANLVELYRVSEIDKFFTAKWTTILFKVLCFILEAFATIMLGLFADKYAGVVFVVWCLKWCLDFSAKLHRACFLACLLAYGLILALDWFGWGVRLLPDLPKFKGWVQLKLIHYGTEVIKDLFI